MRFDIIWDVMSIAEDAIDFSVILTVLVLAGLPFMFCNDHFKNLKKDMGIKLSLAVLPLFWLSEGLYAVIFHGSAVGRRAQLGAEDFLWIFSLVFLLYGCFLLYKNRTYRVLTVVLFLVNFIFIFLADLGAGCSITGACL